MQRTFSSFKGNIFCSFMTGVTCVYHSRLSSFSLSVCLFPSLIVRGLICCQLYAICNIGLNLLFHTIIVYKLMNKPKNINIPFVMNMPSKSTSLVNRWIRSKYFFSLTVTTPRHIRRKKIFIINLISCVPNILFSTYLFSLAQF